MDTGRHEDNLRHAMEVQDLSKEHLIVALLDAERELSTALSRITDLESELEWAVSNLPTHTQEGEKT